MISNVPIWLGISSLLFCLCSVKQVATLLPQVSQEGLLRPYRSYADVTLFHYYVPKEVVTATFEFAAFMDNPSCPVRTVYVFLQHGSYPVMAADNGEFPPKFYLGRTSMFNLTLKSSYQPPDARKFPVSNPLPGSWFAAGYLPNWDQPVQQEGIGHKCQYSLGSIGLWTQISTIHLEKSTKLRSTGHNTYFKFYIPAGVWKFKIEIFGCQFTTNRRFPAYEVRRDKFVTVPTTTTTTTTSTTTTIPRDFNTTDLPNENLTNSVCIRNVFMRARGLPDISLDSGNTKGVLTDATNSTWSETVKLPYTDSYYYVVIVSDSKITFNVSITVQECPVEMLGRSFIQQFPGTGTTISNTKEQAVRLNTSKTITTNSTEVLEEDDCNICPRIFHLTRIKHAQDFSDTFLLQGDQWFTTWLALDTTRNTSVGVAMELLPYVDIGGTLSINIHLDELPVNSTSQILTVFGCVSMSRPPETFCCLSAGSGNISDCCESGLSLHISTENRTTLDDSILIPYPEPDKYYISLTPTCYLDGVEQECEVKQPLVSLDIRTQPCVLTKPNSPGDPILPCGRYGICQEVHKGQFFYTSCRCIGGYRGWDCSDDSEATPEHILLLTTLLLALSNIFFIPAIFLALRRRMFTHSMIYLATMVSSAMYHACDQDIYGYCLTRYQVLQFCDFFCSILAFWVTLIALAKSPPKYESALYMLGAMVIAIGVEYNRTGLMVFIVPFSLGIGIPVTVWTYRSIQTRSLIKPTLNTILLFIPGVLLGAAGLILFAFVETEDNYRYTHSAWHVIIALSLVYLLPKKWIKNNETENSADVSNSAELAGVNGYQPNPTSSSPIFFITSELDHLVHENPR